ncbi:putative Phenylalanyl-tRNA synthetase beta subunit [Thiomonas arsenitoxydans]|uniref:Phenylalanyl-tRNA synthetase beta subunit n=1 Tax=Thiomonas arsenitoxydans (strain DSM 22701 / CIP 110005 / 3As) TaxID=426114 RepID=D6CKX7_THIA3|nr:phenylalanine--tRNA ligase beta subunit-related protein [Thiomonas arsenitoxydans]CAZ87730.1 putative Phenylalanyl-tRNA synthetase beta subunit [Thiomonas arsenitoxydans]CQR26744.1 putative Phenylalanyl-tRNA synthetase beta subunit [Thiomonas arsenitoxydans]CQR30658.1 putative Phenylalanyl-tRNA synthetase beta subunit [Thiomonas arsenitoxydans]CQR30680.1 putative Phenylalanyl-tRNA synthetase beta subunit [Thiomonas arsenitoxydans]CQR31924.1 putative Phenylalanyl-tRNA synthetase beta subunit
MLFSYSQSLRDDFPELSTGVLHVQGISSIAETDVADYVAQLTTLGRQRIAAGTEADLPEIQAWRRVFSRMGLKPTQYRCASEALLRRLRKEGDLPSVLPFVDLCNSVSAAFAIPVAAFDLDRVAGGLVVRRATGTERYDTFSGEIEHPEAGEVIFADAKSRAHARRWTNRQSAYSAVSSQTHNVLIVAEAMHGTAKQDVSRLIVSLTETIRQLWPAASVREGTS